MCSKTRRRFKKTTTSISKRLHEQKNDLPELQRGRRAWKGAANLQVCATSWHDKWRDVACPMREANDPWRWTLCNTTRYSRPPFFFSSPPCFYPSLAQLFYIKSMVVHCVPNSHNPSSPMRRRRRRGMTMLWMLLSWCLQPELNLPTNNPPETKNVNRLAHLSP